MGWEFQAVLAVIGGCFVFAMGYFLGAADASEDRPTLPIGELRAYTDVGPNTRAGEAEFLTAATRAFDHVTKYEGLYFGPMTVVAPQDSGMPGRWYAEAKVIGRAAGRS